MSSASGDRSNSSPRPVDVTRLGEDEGVSKAASCRPESIISASSFQALPGNAPQVSGFRREYALFPEHYIIKAKKDLSGSTRLSNAGMAWTLPRKSLKLRLS